MGPTLLRLFRNGGGLLDLTLPLNPGVEKVPPAINNFGQFIAESGKEKTSETLRGGHCLCFWCKHLDCGKFDSSSAPVVHSLMVVAESW